MPSPLAAASVAWLIASIAGVASGVANKVTAVASTCSTHSAEGKDIDCVNGACYDGTFIGQPGLCAGFNNVCLDVNPAPSCASNQVLANINQLGHDAGKGYYYASVYLWQQHTWTWDCCDCPAGYISSAYNCENSGDTYGNFCFGCTDPEETVQYNEQAGVSICQGPGYAKQACEMVAANNVAIDIASDIATLLGAYCAASVTSLLGKAEVASLLLLDIENIASVLHSGFTPGVTGTGISAAIAIIATFKSVSLGIAFAIAEAAGFASPVGLLYNALCAVDSAVSLLLSSASTYNNFDPACKSTLLNSRDLLSPSHTSITYSDNDDASGSKARIRRRTKRLARRGDNICEEFLLLFPVNVTALQALNTACEQVDAYSSADTTSAGVANTTSAIQAACGLAQSNSSLYIVTTFLGELLQAVENFAPYCDNSLLSLSNQTNNSMPSAAATIGLSAAATQGASNLTTSAESAGTLPDHNNETSGSASSSSARAALAFGTSSMPFLNVSVAGSNGAVTEFVVGPSKPTQSAEPLPQGSLQGSSNIACLFGPFRTQLE